MSLSCPEACSPGNLAEAQNWGQQVLVNNNKSLQSFTLTMFLSAFTWVDSFTHNLMKQMLLLFSFYRRGSQSTEVIRNLPEVTWTLTAGSKSWIQVVWFQVHTLHSHTSAAPQSQGISQGATKHTFPMLAKRWLSCPLQNGGILTPSPPTNLDKQKNGAFWRQDSLRSEGLFVLVES